MFNAQGRLPHDHMQHSNWTQPRGPPASAGHDTSHHSSMMHSSNCPPSSQSSAPWGGPHLHRPPLQQQWSAPAAATAATASSAPAPSSFNYGFGQHAPPAQHTSINSNAHNSNSSHFSFMGPAGDNSINQQPGRQPMPAPDHEADSLKSVNDLPAAFRSLFNFRCARGASCIDLTTVSATHPAADRCECTLQPLCLQVLQPSAVRVF